MSLWVYSPLQGNHLAPTIFFSTKYFLIYFNNNAKSLTAVIAKVISSIFMQKSAQQFLLNSCETTATVV
jgi:hypothetical protein